MTRRLTHLTILGLLCCLPLLAGFNVVPAARPADTTAPNAITLTMVASAPDATTANLATDSSAASLPVLQSAAPATDIVIELDLAEPMNGFGGGLPATALAEPIQPPAAPPVQDTAAAAPVSAPVALPLQARKPPAPRASVTWV